MFEIKQWDGGQITEPGIYAGVPISRYHHDPDLFPGFSVSSTGLRRVFHKSPLHFFDKSSLHPNPEPDDETEYMVKGRAAHLLLAKETGFWNEFAVQPATYADAKTGEEKPWNNNANVCKAWHADVAKTAKSVMTQKSFEHVTGIMEAVSKVPEKEVLFGIAELTIVYRDETTGILVKSRPDNVFAETEIVDFKIMEDTSDRAIEKAVDTGLNMQGALARRAFHEVTGRRPTSVSLFVVESVRPYSIRVDSMTDEDLDLGDRQNRVALDLIAHGIRSGQWPGIENKAGTGGYISMPPWRRAAHDDRVKYLASLIPEPNMSRAAE